MVAKASLYDLPEAGAMWYVTLNRYHRTDLGMRHTETDSAVLAKHDVNGKLEGLSVLQFDDSVIRGSD